MDDPAAIIRYELKAFGLKNLMKRDKSGKHNCIKSNKERTKKKKAHIYPLQWTRLTRDPLSFMLAIASQRV